MRKLLFVALVAFLAAAAIGFLTESVPYAVKLIRIQVEQQLGNIDKRITDEPLAVQALLLDYAGGDKPETRGSRDALVLKAWVALLKYPLESREVLQLYGTKPEFQEILQKHGESVIPVIKYFLDNDILSLKVQATVIDSVKTVKEKVIDTFTKVKNGFKDIWNKGSGNTPEPRSPQADLLASQSVKTEFGSMDRGWYAINSIKSDGHKFLGQFSLDTANVAHWNQVDRTVTTVASFLTGGLSNLERKYELDEKIKSSDVFFAAIDVIPFVAAVKLLKAGKVVAFTSKELSLVSRTRVFAARLIPKNAFLKSMGKYGVVLATGYVVLSHPALLNSVFAEIAELMGLNPMLIQFLGWFLIVSIALYPFTWILRSLAYYVFVGIS